jgi:nanoRNase/pAp phosphatase (c-di-AMP/oligoRNAs hydrolase)
MLAAECGTFGLLWYVSSRGTINCSLRSQGEYDVSKIAKVFGGGGHRNASGFQLSSFRELEKFFDA